MCQSQTHVRLREELLCQKHLVQPWPMSRFPAVDAGPRGAPVTGPGAPWRPRRAAPRVTRPVPTTHGSRRPSTSAHPEHQRHPSTRERPGMTRGLSNNNSLIISPKELFYKELSLLSKLDAGVICKINCLTVRQVTGSQQVLRSLPLL